MEEFIRSVISKYNDFKAEAILYEKWLSKVDDPDTRNHLTYVEFAPQPSPNQAIADNRSIEQRICIKPAKRSRQRDLSLLVRFMQRRATPITQKDVSRR